MDVDLKLFDTDKPTSYVLLFELYLIVWPGVWHFKIFASQIPFPMLFNGET